MIAVQQVRKNHHPGIRHEPILIRRGAGPLHDDLRAGGEVDVGRARRLRLLDPPAQGVVGVRDEGRRAVLDRDQPVPGVVDERPAVLGLASERKALCPRFFPVPVSSPSLGRP